MSPLRPSWTSATSALATSALAAAILVWATPVLPQQDTPNHVAITAALHAVGAGDPSASEHFESVLTFAPYHGFYVAALALTSFVDASSAVRVLVGAYAGGFVLAFAFFLGALDPRKRLLAPLGIVAVFSDSYFLGFLPFLAALPLVLLLWGATVRAVRGGPRATTMLAFAVFAGLSALWFHPMAAGVGLAGALALALAFATDRAGAVRGAFAVGVPGVALVAALLGQVRDEPTLRLSRAFDVEYLARSTFFAADLLGGVMRLLGALSVLGVLAVVAHGMARSREGRRFAVRWRGSALLLLAVLLALYFVLPFGRGAGVWLNLRLAPLVLCALVALVPADVADGSLVRWAAWAHAMVLLVAVAQCHLGFDAEARAFEAATAAMPTNARVLPLFFDRKSRVFEPFYVESKEIPFYAAYTHFASYAVANRGGVTPFMTFQGTLAWVPLRLRNPAYARDFAIVDVFRPKTLLKRLPGLASEFDVVLARGADAEQSAALNKLGVRIAESGPFAVYRLR